MKPHRTLRATAFWQECWGFSHQNCAVDSNGSPLSMEQRAWSFSCWFPVSAAQQEPSTSEFPPHCPKPDRWPGSSRQPRQPCCSYLESPVRITHFKSHLQPNLFSTRQKTPTAGSARAGSACAQQCCPQDKRMSCRHRASSMPSLLPAKRTGDGRGTHSTQNILKHREPGTLQLWQLAEPKQKSRETPGKVHFKLEAHEWTPFCLIPPGACKQQPLNLSLSFSHPTKRWCLSTNKGILF